MARTSNRVLNYVSAKGNAQKMSLEDLYYKTEDLLTAICDISRQYKSLGWSWYCNVRDGMYATAINSLNDGHRYDYKYVKGLIEELRDLLSDINRIEKGGDN